MVPQYDRMPDVPDSDDDMNDVQDDGDVPTSLSTVFEKGIIFGAPRHTEPEVLSLDV